MGSSFLNLSPEIIKDWLPLGKIGSPHGVAGVVRLHLSNPASDSLGESVQVALEKEGVFIAFVTVKKNWGNQRILFHEMATREQAKEVAQANIWVKRSDLPLKSVKEVYLADLIGASAQDKTGKSLGQVIGFSDNGAQILIQIQTLSGKKILIPFVKPLLSSIQEEEGVVILDLPPGLM